MKIKVYAYLLLISTLVILLTNCGNMEQEYVITFDLTNLNALSLNISNYEIVNTNISINHLTKIFIYRSNVIQEENDGSFSVSLTNSLISPVFSSNSKIGSFFDVEVTDISSTEDYTIAILSWDPTLIQESDLIFADFKDESFLQTYKTVLQTNLNSVIIGILLPSDISPQDVVQIYNTETSSVYEYNEETYYPLPLGFFQFTQSSLTVSNLNILYITALNISNERAVEKSTSDFENAINNDDTNAIQDILSPYSVFYITDSFSAFLNYFDGFRPVNYLNLLINVSINYADVFSDATYADIPVDVKFVMRREPLPSFLFPNWKVYRYYDIGDFDDPVWKKL